MGLAHPIIHTSKYSYLDLNGNRLYDVGEEMGSYIVGVSIRVGRGMVVLIPDADFISNMALRNASNYEFVRDLVSKDACWLVLAGLDVTDIEHVRLLIVTMARVIGLDDIEAVAAYMLLIFVAWVIYRLEVGP